MLTLQAQCSPSNSALQGSLYQATPPQPHPPSNVHTAILQPPKCLWLWIGYVAYIYLRLLQSHVDKPQHVTIHTQI